MDALIVDDHELIRDALKGLLGGVSDIETIFEAATASEAARMLARHADIGLVLLDLSLPDQAGTTLLHSMRADRPEVSVVVLSASEDKDDMTSALKAGAAGFIPKSASNDVMKGALKLVFAGGVYVPPEILSAPPSPAQPSASPLAFTRIGLTERQAAVLQQMMHGKSNKEICRALDIAEPTVKNHVTAILRALGASNRTEAVVAASALMASVER
ncbi:MAG: response regulator transcription factor [Paracoccaceae bacterium]|nr:response regulator transcription factor [Paracoccaceae bacterium]